jgi:hypothetical protein
LNEKLRFQSSANRTEVEIDINLGRLPLTRLALYILSLPLDTRKQQWDILNQALEKSAAFTLRKSPLKLGRVASVLDCSYSSFGSAEKHRRPLGVALATHYLLKAASQEYHAFWTASTSDPLLILPRGQTDLATPLLDALDWGADLVVLVTDGWGKRSPQWSIGNSACISRSFRPETKNFHYSLQSCLQRR